MDSTEQKEKKTNSQIIEERFPSLKGKVFQELTVDPKWSDDGGFEFYGNSEDFPSLWNYEEKKEAMKEFDPDMVFLDTVFKYLVDKQWLLKIIDECSAGYGYDNMPESVDCYKEELKRELGLIK